MGSKMKTIISFSLLCLPFIIACDNLNNINENSSWILQRDKQDDIIYYSIFFSDKNSGWICGFNGMIKNTTDGGNTWKSQQSSVSANLWDISFINNLHGWICGANNTILKTSDGGKSWINISPLNSENKIYVSIKFIDENNGWTSNNFGEIQRTTNGGISWDIKRSGHIGGSRLSVFNAQIIYALSGKLYKTINGGETWDSVEVSIPKNYMISEMFFIDTNNGWVVTENGTGGMMITEFPVVITNNGGRTWASSELLKDEGMRSIYFLNENVGWVAGSQNVYKTIDGGKHWAFEFSPSNGELFAKDMYFVDENNGWIINWDGKIYKYQKMFN
jgi:photosystem II stability/assembly factor-like uncharacterized protein